MDGLIVTDFLNKKNELSSHFAPSIIKWCRRKNWTKLRESKTTYFYVGVKEVVNYRSVVEVLKFYAEVHDTSTVELNFISMLNEELLKDREISKDEFELILKYFETHPHIPSGIYRNNLQEYNYIVQKINGKTDNKTTHKYIYILEKERNNKICITRW